MRKLPQPVFKRLPPLILYLDYIANIVSLLKAFSPSVAIFTEQQEYEVPFWSFEKNWKVVYRTTSPSLQHKRNVDFG